MKEEKQMKMKAMFVMIISLLLGSTVSTGAQTIRILEERQLMISDVFKLNDGFNHSEYVRGNTLKFPFEVLQKLPDSVTGQYLYYRYAEPFTRELIVSSSDSVIEKVVLNVVPARFNVTAPDLWKGESYDGGVQLNRVESENTFNLGSRTGRSVVGGELTIRFMEDSGYKSSDDIYHDLQACKKEGQKVSEITLDDFIGYVYTPETQFTEGYAGGSGLYDAQYSDYMEGYVIKGHQVIYIYLHTYGYSDYTNTDKVWLINKGQAVMMEVLSIFNTVHLSAEGERHVGTPTNYTGTQTTGKPSSNGDRLSNNTALRDEAEPYVLTMDQERIEGEFGYYLPGFDACRSCIHYENGVLKIERGPAWSKNGIYSYQPVVKITEDLADNPVVFHFDIIPELSRGFQICFTEECNDFYLHQNENANIFYRTQQNGAKTGLSLYNPLSVTNNSYTSWAGFKMPERITVRIYSNRIVLEDSLNNRLERLMEFAQLDDTLFLYLFTVPDEENSDCSLALKTITIERGSNKLPVKQAAYPAVSGTPIFSDDFNGLDETKWVRFQDTGGNYTDCYQLIDGVFDVSIPKWHEWASVGIKSREALFKVPPPGETRLITIQLKSDNFHSYGLVLDQLGYDSGLWSRENMRYTFVTHQLLQSSYVSLADSIDYGKAREKFLNQNYSVADNRVIIEISSGKAKVYTAWGDVFEYDYAWMKEGIPIYLYLMAYAYDYQLPGHLAVDSITVY